MNHVFTCAGCGRQWSIESTSKLECFFVGLCYWCIRESGLGFDLIATVLRFLLSVWMRRKKVTLTSRKTAKPAPAGQ